MCKSVWDCPILTDPMDINSLDRIYVDVCLRMCQLVVVNLNESKAEKSTLCTLHIHTWVPYIPVRTLCGTNTSPFVCWHFSFYLLIRLFCLFFFCIFGADGRVCAQHFQFLSFYFSLAFLSAIEMRTYPTRTTLCRMHVGTTLTRYLHTLATSFCVLCLCVLPAWIKERSLVCSR